MKFFKYFLETITLNQEIGKDIKNEDKSIFNDEELKLQISKGEIICKNIREISIWVLKLCFSIFFISMFSVSIYYFITKNGTTTVNILCIIFSILFLISVSYCIFTNKVSDIKFGIENAKNNYC